MAGEFKNFGDLRKARGGKEPPPAEPVAKQRARDEERAPEPPEPPEDVRGTIAARPPAFGPMESGPACYRDVESEELQLFASFRVRTVFPDDVQREVKGLPRDPTAADKQGRLDLRGEPIFTIDGEDAKDFDDAISIKELGGGRYEVGVHIADVGHYVQSGTALDAEALARATSVYVADQVVPMLPEALSNHLCSLVEGRDRLTYSVIMEFDAKGKRVASRVRKSVIQSVKRCTYGAVQALLDGEQTPEARALAGLEQPLRQFERWTKVQQGLRDAKGSLRIESREKKFVFDAKHDVVAVVDYPRYFSNTLIEETALAANQAVGDLFRARGLPTIYRVHPEKDPEEIEAVAAELEQHGIRVPVKERLTGRDIGRMIRAARKRPNSDALIQRIMGLVERAEYAVKDHVDVAGHFGLAREAYLHFTSPIRRYPDLVVHRWLWAVESRGKAAEAELATDDLLQDLNDIASHASMQAEVAEMVEYAVADLKVCQFMHPHVGEKLKARLQRVSRAGLEIALTDFNVSGFLPASALGDRIEVKGPTLLARRGRQSRSFSEGHPIAVRLIDVDFVRLQLMLELA